MCCLCGACEAVGIVLAILAISVLGAYGVKAAYVASLEHRDPSLFDAFSEKFWAPEGTAFWVTFFVLLIVLLLVWFLAHQLCSCFAACRRRESATAPQWWRKMQADTPASEKELEESGYYRQRSADDESFDYYMGKD